MALYAMSSTRTMTVFGVLPVGAGAGRVGSDAARVRPTRPGKPTLRETLRRLMHAVLDHCAGQMDDDATVLPAEWRGGYQDELTPASRAPPGGGAGGPFLQ